VLYVTTRPGPYVEEASGAHNVQSDTTGTGRAIVLRDGLVYSSATWRRPAVNAPFTVTTGGGSLALAPGQTWLELVPTTATVTTG
jgi:hypothetical protein